MRRPTVFDPRYLTHARPTVNGTQTAYGIVLRGSGERPDWQPESGITVDEFTPIWRGHMRIQPNIDWRARQRDNEGEWDATMATRFQLPMEQNELGAVIIDGKIQYAPDPLFTYGDVIDVLAVHGDGQGTLLHKRFTVRMALPSSNMWLHNLLCDSGTTGHG